MITRRAVLSAPLLAAPGVLRAGGPVLRGFLRTNWGADPFAMGAYSYVARGASRADHRALGAPLGRLFFAGEAAHPHYNSTVHAAYESGIRAAAQVRRTKARHIAVIGAGVAGLAAADALWAEGRDVRVIEARQRIGGRIHTRSDLGPPLDLGASWIHGAAGNPIARLAREAGLTTVETGDDYILRGAGGRRIWPVAAPGWLLEVSEIQHSFGAAADQIDLGAYGETDGYPGPELVFPRGYGGVIGRLTSGFPTLTGAEVRRIAHDANGVTIVSGRGDARSRRYDAAICTLPLGVLKAGSVAFDPPLPPEKQRAITRLGVGLLDKLYLMFDAPFWDDQTWILTPETGLPRGQFNQWLNLDRVFGLPILLAFNGADPARALADLPDQTLVDRAMAALRAAYP